MHLRRGDLQQRGLAGAVRAQDHPPLALVHGPVDAVEQGRAAAHDVDGAQVQHLGDRHPTNLPAGARRTGGRTHRTGGPSLGCAVPVPHRSARLVAWSNAVALGLASPDLAAAEVVADDPPHRVVGLGPDPVSMPVLLAMVRRSGQATARLALPVPGDPVGLPATDPVLVPAIEAGEVAVLPDVTAAASDAGDALEAAWGLVPAVEESGVRWTAYRTAGSTPTNGATSLPDAEQGLAQSLREATAVLDRLDAASWTDQDADDVAALRSGRLDGDGLAPGYPDRAAAVLVRARRLRTIVRLASRGDGGTLTASAAVQRVAALAPLDRAARHAEMAAYNAVADSRPASAP